MNNPGIIYDFWNNFENVSLQLANGIEYIALGSHGKSGFKI